MSATTSTEFFAATGVSHVVRNWKKTGALGSGAIVCLALAGWLCFVVGPQMFPGYVMGGAFVIAGGILALFGWAGSGSAECPNCDGYVFGVSTSVNEGVLCGECLSYLEGENGELRVTAPDRVARSCLFETTLGAAVHWPDGCCVCTAPATRMLEVKVVDTQDAAMHKNVAVGVATLGTLKLVEKKSWSAKVPHCDAHDDGAVLRVPSAEQEHMALTEPPAPVIAFRSMRYFKAYCLANSTKPAVRASLWD